LTNRSRTEIVVQILESASASDNSYDEDGGIIQTKIMYDMPIASAQLKEYVKVLIERDLLSFDSVQCRFKTTQKGRRFLEIYNKVGSIITEEEV
jgi:predicted transcriptional regulator